MCIRDRQTRGKFELNEKLLIDGKTTDLSVVEIRDDYIKIDGKFEIKKGDRITGRLTNVSAEITSIVGNKAKFKTDFSNRQEYGWLDDIGKLNQDYQVIPDNDYYQNLSYTVKSTIEWDKFVNPVNRLVHPAGLKNFADTSIESKVSVGVGTTALTKDLIVLDIANILGLEFEAVPCNNDSSINTDLLPIDLSESCLVLTAGTTAAGAIDNLNIANNAAWVHVDAAWAGPLRISQKHGNLLNGIEKADSISISGHKWIFQPKDSSILLFKNTAEANQSISMSAGYLSSSNIGIMGSRGAIGLPLLATLMAWGKEGLAKRLDGCMTLSDELHSHLLETGVYIFAKPTSGVILWQPNAPYSADEIFLRLPAGSASLATISGEKWIRHVAANPNMKIDLLCSEITTALGY